jgi:hypothetical protein
MISKVYSIKMPSGTVVGVVADSPTKARDLLGVKGSVVIGSTPWTRTTKQCGGDCGDCNGCGGAK